jgi:hypothetical protein
MGSCVGLGCGFGSYALFLEVITEETDQHCSTFWLPQRGQIASPFSYSARLKSLEKIFLQAWQ